MHKDITLFDTTKFIFKKNSIIKPKITPKRENYPLSWVLWLIFSIKSHYDVYQLGQVRTDQGDTKRQGIGLHLGVKCQVIN